MDALDRASVSKAEERQKRVLEIGNELLQNPPSSKEELLEKLDAMGLFSNTKQRNSPKTSKEQHERKNSPSQKEALSSVLITKKNNLPKISKVQLKRKNSLSQEEALGSVSITKRSDLPKTSKEQCKRKYLASREEKSADKVVREHGVDLVGCRVRVWWPLDKVFYEGHITSFDQSEKKHTVNYDDGDQEILNLTNEHWELVEDDNTSNPIQESLPDSSDIFDMPLSCIIDSFRHTRKKKKCCEKRKWMPWIVLLFLRWRSARKELLKLGMSCFNIPHLLKRSFWRNLMLWVCSQTPKKAISPKLLKNNVKGRPRRHKKRH